VDVPTGPEVAGAEVGATELAGAELAGAAEVLAGAEAGVAVATQAQTALAEAWTLSAVLIPHELMTQFWAEFWSAELLEHWQA